MKFLVSVLIFFFIQRSCCRPNASASSLIETIFENYDKMIRPGYGGEPVVVNVNMYIGSFGSIKETNMEYETFGYFRQYWRDERLAGKVNESVILTGTEISNLWKPDPFCDNCTESNLKESDETINSFVKLYPSGRIAYSRLFKVKAECKMDLQKFPMDEQKCGLKISSYSFSTDYILFLWHPENQVSVGNTSMAQFEMKSVEITNTTDKYFTGAFAAVIVTFTFKRRVGYYLIQVYAPDVFVVMLSWIVFWMDRDDMGNRMALGITIILTIMFLLGSTNTTMPRVSYPKALDWYLLISFGFVFFALVECVIVYIVREKKVKKKKVPPPALKSLAWWTIPSLSPENTNGISTTSLTENHISSSKKKTCELQARSYAAWIDITSRIIFPTAFLIYNIVYCFQYLG